MNDWGPEDPLEEVNPFLSFDEKVARAPLDAKAGATQSAPNIAKCPPTPPADFQSSALEDAQNKSVKKDGPQKDKLQKGRAQNDKVKPKDHRHGHRDRLRQRFLRNGIDALHDYELLELLLFMAIPRRDVKPLAKDLINRFGSVAEVFSKSVGSLEAAGLSQNAIASLKAVEAAAVILARHQILDTPIISSWQALLDYLTTAMARRDKEQFRCLFLDKKNRLIADEVQNEGTVDHTAVYPREIARRALELNASALILVHNHPSGDPKPSRGDIQMTREIKEALQKLEILVHDHVIVGRRGHTSFKSQGLL